MRRTAIAAVVSFLSTVAGAAPPDSPASRAHVRNVRPASIDSEASLEYFIGAAGRLVKGDTSRDLATLESRLSALKTQKSALQQKLREKEREIAGTRAAAAAQGARAERDALSAQLAKVESTIADLLRQIERLRDEERREQDEIKAAEDALDALSRSLANAALQRTAIAGALSSMDAFAKGLPPAKKRETEDRIRRARAQLAEARRLRLSLHAPSPAARILPR